jgi:hypothetical protein
MEKALFLYNTAVCDGTEIGDNAASPEGQEHPIIDRGQKENVVLITSDTEVQALMRSAHFTQNLVYAGFEG